MAKRYIYNEGSTPITVGGVFIPPFDGREIDEHLLPPEHQPAPLAEEAAAPNPDANLQELLAGSVASIAATLEGLGTDTLNRLSALEGAAAKPRKTLQEAIAAELLKRAGAAVDGESEGQVEGEANPADFQDTQPGGQ